MVRLHEKTPLGYGDYFIAYCLACYGASALLLLPGKDGLFASEYALVVFAPIAIPGVFLLLPLVLGLSFSDDPRVIWALIIFLVILYAAIQWVRQWATRPWLGYLTGAVLILYLMLGWYLLGQPPA